MRLASSQPYRFGSLVPAGSLSAWNIAQNGRLSLAVSTATAWPASNGILAEITFQVQPSAAQTYSWPVALSAAEITQDGYETRALLPTGASLIGRAPVAGSFSAPGRNASGLFQFTLNGDTGASYTIEASADLIHWTPVTTLLIEGGNSIQFADPDSNTSPRYYRTVIIGQ